MNDRLPFLHLMAYLSNTSLVSAIQFVLLAAIFHLVVYRSLRRLGWLGSALSSTDRVADDLVQSLAQLNIGLGLLLTFSGVYGLIGAGNGQDGSWPLLMALGSSALGYSGYAACALGSVLDSVRRDETRPEPAAVAASPQQPGPPQPAKRRTGWFGWRGKKR